MWLKDMSVKVVINMNGENKEVGTVSFVIGSNFFGSKSIFLEKTEKDVL